MRWDEIEGWFDYEKLYKDVAGWLPFGGVAVEVGCWHGRSLAYLGAELVKSNKPFQLWGVDIAVGSPEHADDMPKYGGNIAGKLVGNLAACGLFPSSCGLILAPSTRAASFFRDESLDFVFVDAAHDFESVSRDLAAWYPKVRVGGRIAGHDYNMGWADVLRGVDTFFGKSTGALRSELSHSCWELTRVS